MSEQRETFLSAIEAYLNGDVHALDATGLTFPPTAAKTLGFDLIAAGDGTASVALDVDPARHSNPMGTMHGGVMCDIADFAIGTAHMTGLVSGESFTSIDLQIAFFRPVFEGRVVAAAKAVHRGRTLSRYVCDITDARGKLMAQLTSSVMTLRGDRARGR